LAASLLSRHGDYLGFQAIRDAVQERLGLAGPRQNQFRSRFRTT
jgi:hypothetical protein